MSSTHSTMSKIEPLTYILPAIYASSLINSDESGLNDEDIEELNNWLEKEQPGTCIGCSDESYFKWGHDMKPRQGADVLEFYFHKIKP